MKIENSYNSEYFNREKVEKGLHIKFIELLLELDENDYKGCHDIHLYREENAITVEWCYKWYDKSMGNDRFEFLGEDDVVMTEVFLPDNSSVYVKNADEEKEVLEDWLKEHPTYKKNEWGRWYDENEQKAWEEWVKKNCPEYAEVFDKKDDLSNLHIGDHTDHTEDGYDVVECIANDEQGENCDNDCDTCKYNSNNKEEVEEEVDGECEGEVGW